MLDYELSQDGKAVIKLDKQIYPLKAVYRVCYRFLDDYYIGINQDALNYFVYISKKNSQIRNIDIGEFQNELLDQCLKLAIGEETRNVRDLIVARALYSAFIPEENTEQKTETDTECKLDEIAKAWYNEEYITE